MLPSHSPVGSSLRSSAVIDRPSRMKGAATTILTSSTATANEYSSRKAATCAGTRPARSR